MILNKRQSLPSRVQNLPPNPRAVSWDGSCPEVLVFKNCCVDPKRPQRLRLVHYPPHVKQNLSFVPLNWVFNPKVYFIFGKAQGGPTDFSTPFLIDVNFSMISCKHRLHLPVHSCREHKMVRLKGLKGENHNFNQHSSTNKRESFKPNYGSCW